MCQVIGLGIIGKMKKIFQLLTDKDWEPCLEYLLNLRGKAKLTVTIQKYRKRRSTEFNNFYWGACVTPLAEHCGYRKEEMHQILMMGYYGVEQREFNGKKYDFPRRTTTTPDTVDSLDFKGLSDYAMQIAAELGVIIQNE